MGMFEISETRIEGLKKKWPNLRVLSQKAQLMAMMTILRDKNTNADEFVFYADRVIRLLIEEALNELPLEPHTVIAPTGSVFKGLKYCEKLCGVSIVRAGESMENALMTVCRGCRIGKILIQRDEETREPKLFYTKLPKDIAKRHTLLLDPMCATAGSVCKALEVLTIEYRVPQNKIIFINLVAAPVGLERIFQNFPDIIIVCASIDDGLDHKAYIVPGIGDFGDRYFETE